MPGKANIIIFIVILIVLLFFVPVLSSVLTDLIEVYKFRLASMPDNFLAATLREPATYIKFFTRVNPPNILGWAAIGLYLILSLTGRSKLRQGRIYARRYDYGSHGTSRFQNKKEIKNNYFKTKLGWFLGSDKPGLDYHPGMDGMYHPLEGSLNMQTAIFGSPGSLKTTGFVLPNIFHIPFMYKDKNEKPDIIITDPKSELYSLSANYLIENGYDVHVLDFINLKYGDSLNPIEFIKNDKELIEIAEGFISSSADAGGSSFKSDPFWEQSEGQLLGALIGYILQIYPAYQQTFSEVLKLLTSQNVRNIEKAEVFFKEFDIKGAAAQLWQNYLLAEDKVRANILIGFATKLKLFSIEGIKNITGSTTMDIQKLGAKKQKPIAIYIIMPDKDQTFSPVINSIITTILNQLYKSANNSGGTLANPVYLILEEMANIGKIPGIEVMLGTMRSRKIYPMLVWQSLAQMKNRYKDSWEDILSMCDSHLYLGINDDFTARYCSSSLGDTTIRVQATSKNSNSLLGEEMSSESQSYYRRSLLFADECRRLPSSNLILSQRSLFPLILYKVQYRYWQEDKKICSKADLNRLPVIKNTCSA